MAIISTKTTKTDNIGKTIESFPRTKLAIWRSVLIGALLIPLNVLWVTISEVRWYNLDGTCLPLFIEPVFFLFLLVLANMAYKRLAKQPDAGLRQEEMLIVYIMLVTSCAFCGHDTLQNLFGCITHPFWFANASNRWQQLFLHYLPSWLYVNDSTALTGWYNGGVNIYSADAHRYLAPWIVPLAAWGVLFLTLYGMYLCITILIRRAWVESEKLSFPIVQLPLAMTAENAPAAFFGNRVMWAGFLVAATISTLNGIHTLTPSVPQLNVKLFDIQPYFTTPPWNSIGMTNTSFYPFMIGLAYFMPLDLSLSCWSFYLFAKAFRIYGAANGYFSGAQGFPFFGEQATGAWLGIALMLLYSSRHYWKGVLISAWQGLSADDPAEAVRYRFAMGGLVAGTIVLSVFTALIGMSIWVGVGLFAIIFLLGFVITRVRAEFGCPHEISWCNPCQILVGVFGTQAIGPQNLTLLSALYWFNRCYRNHPMPNQLEAFKMLDNKRVTFGSTIAVLVLSAFLALGVTYWANLHVTYAAGAAAQAVGYKGFVGKETFDRLGSWLTMTTPPASRGMYYMVGGFVFAVVLLIMRNTLEWWPLHPTGYALALSFAMEYFWLPVFIAWFVKFVVMRYGGAKLYRATIPFFLGLILGDYTVGSLWSLTGCLGGFLTYKIYI